MQKGSFEDCQKIAFSFTQKQNNPVLNVPKTKRGKKQFNGAKNLMRN